MKHVDLAGWADFVRGLGSGAERAAMKRHLEDGCASCRATVAAFEQVVRCAAAESAMAAPSGTVRSVKAFFAAQHPKAASRSAPRLLPVYDSAALPAPTGFRGKGDRRRRLLFESDAYKLEVSVDSSPGVVDAVLRGQLFEAHGAPRSHAPVFLVGDGEVVGRAISEEHGDFEMSGRLDQTSELWVFPDDQNRIRVSLKPQH